MVRARWQIDDRAAMSAKRAVRQPDDAAASLRDKLAAASMVNDANAAVAAPSKLVQITRASAKLEHARLLEDTLKMDLQKAQRGGGRQGGVLPYIVALALGWICGSGYMRLQLQRAAPEACLVQPCTPQPCDAAPGSQASPPAPPVAASGVLPALRVAVIDDVHGPGANSVALHRQAFQAVGFRVAETIGPPYAFDILWSHHSVNLTQHKLLPTHRFNHIPGMSVLCQKGQFGRFAHDNRLEYVPRYYTSSARDAAYLVSDMLSDNNYRFVVKGRGHRGVRMMTADEIMTIAGASADEPSAPAVGDGVVVGGGDDEGVHKAAMLLTEMLKDNLVQQFITDGLLVDGHKYLLQTTQVCNYTT